MLLLLTIACLLGWLNAATALAAGLAYGLLLENPFSLVIGKWADLLLKTSIVVLGFTLAIGQLWQTTANTAVITVILVTGAMLLGWGVGKLLKAGNEKSVLISAGTAICGGSAIAAMASTLNTKTENTVVALAIVFLLNAVALFLYPLIGQWLDLSEAQFGIWAALGIHDTSSVVGAASVYGNEALDVAATTKLARALWIIPLVVVTASLQHGKLKVSVPLFIVLFVVASVIGTLLEIDGALAAGISHWAKVGFAVSLLWMGASLNKATIANLPIRPFLLGVILWTIISVSSLAVVYWGFQ